MAGKKTALEVQILNAILRNTSYTSPATVYVGLFTAAPTDSAAGTEVSDSAYARLATTFAAPSGSPSSTSNSNQLDFGIVAGGGYTVVAFAVFDALTSGNQLYWAAVTSQAQATGTRYQFPIGACVVTED